MRNIESHPWAKVFQKQLKKKGFKRVYFKYIIFGKIPMLSYRVYRKIRRKFNEYCK